MGSDYGVIFICECKPVTEYMLEQFYNILEKLRLKKNAYFNIEPEIDPETGEKDYFDARSISVEHPNKDYSYVSIGLHIDGKGLCIEETDGLPSYGLLDVSWWRIGDEVEVANQLLLVWPLLKACHNFLPTSIGAFYINEMANEERLPLIRRKPEKLYDVNFWPRDICEKIGIEKIKTIPYFKVEELESGGFLIYYPGVIDTHYGFHLTDYKELHIAEAHLGFRKLPEEERTEKPKIEEKK